MTNTQIVNTTMTTMTNELMATMATISDIETQKSKIEEDMKNDTVFDEVVTPKQIECKKLKEIVIVESLNDSEEDKEIEEDKNKSTRNKQKKE